MNSDSARLRRRHIDIDVEEELLLFRLYETWRLHFCEFETIVLFATGSFLAPFLSQVPLCLSLAHPINLFKVAIREGSCRGARVIQHSRLARI